jgi:hypothetical protein
MESFLFGDFGTERKHRENADEKGHSSAVLQHPAGDAREKD